MLNYLLNKNSRTFLTTSLFPPLLTSKFMPSSSSSPSTQSNSPNQLKEKNIRRLLLKEIANQQNIPQPLFMERSQTSFTKTQQEIQPVPNKSDRQSFNSNNFLATGPSTNRPQQTQPLSRSI